MEGQMSLVRLLPVVAALLCGGLMLTASVARASVFTVANLSNNDLVPGSLGFAINQANATPGPNTIQFNVAGTIPLMSTLPTISGNLTINGGSLVTASGNNSVTDFSIANGALVTLNGVTITAGNTASNGGGIYNNGGILTVVNTTFGGNTAGADGGGIYNNSGTLTVVNTTFGNSTFGGNTAGADGGGIYNNGGILTVVNTIFEGNTAGADGGGIYNNSGMVTLTNTTFLNNSAIFGNDIFSNGGTVTETPIPATLPLFATGLGALGLLGWRRKRKTLSA
jgi:hypothetical protein